MKQYFERRITYDPTTQNYKISVPELGIEVLSDTEVGGLVEVRKEVENAAKNNNSSLPKLTDFVSTVGFTRQIIFYE